jgi:hypothetical protein
VTGPSSIADDGSVEFSYGSRAHAVPMSFDQTSSEEDTS